MDYSELGAKLEVAQTRDELYKAIVNTPFSNRVEVAMMFLGIVVLLVENKETGMIDRVALSETELAENTTTVSAVPFHEIKIPLDNKDNIIAIAMRTGTPQDTTDWKTLFTPALTPQEARLNQASGGIAYSAVYPVKSSKYKVAMIFSYYQYPHEIGEQQHKFMQQYTETVASALVKFKQ